MRGSYRCWRCGVRQDQPTDTGLCNRRRCRLVALLVGILAAMRLACGCADDDSPPSLDAAAELPRCSTLPGCSGPLVCTAAGVCECMRPGLPLVRCQR